MFSFLTSQSGTEAAVLFAIVYFGSFGLPTGPVFFIIAYAAKASGFSDIARILLVTYAASVAGDLSVYYIARALSENVKNKLAHYRWFSKGAEKIQEPIENYGFPVIFFTRFLAVHLCAIVSYLSGFLKVRPSTFISAVLTGELLYAASYVLLGYAFQDVWLGFLYLALDFSYLVISVLALYFLYKYYLKGKIARLRYRQ